MKPIEPEVKLALALHQMPKGIYALLIGSGVSRSAKIPTGWEITLDLIQKLASTYGESAEPSPEIWYKKKFNKEANYSDLITELASTPAERMSLLSSYFEPNEKDKIDGSKTPTKAHRAIASLVKEGYIKIIITTNFDRLLESAIRDEGVEPDVITSNEHIEGAMPYVHSKNFILKVNGDYKDTRIRNTPKELSEYPKSINVFLDEVFDKFGLIICGWSGDYDIALAERITRCSNRRFTTFWASKGELSESAKNLVKHRYADVINITSADDFFESFNEKVQSLENLNTSHPVSIAVAVSVLKKDLEQHNTIKIYDLINDEKEKLFDQLNSKKFDTIDSFTDELYRERIQEYELMSEKLIRLLCVISFFDSGQNVNLITKCIERLLESNKSDGNEYFIYLQRYPAFLLMYSAGICAIARKRMDILACILRDPKVKIFKKQNKSFAIEVLNDWDVFHNGKNLPIDGANRLLTPVSEYMFVKTRNFVRDLIPSDLEFGESFDIFEFVLGLVYNDIFKVENKWVPVGAFGWKYFRSGTYEGSPISEFLEKYYPKMLEVGLIESDHVNFRTNLSRFTQNIIRIVSNWH